MNSTCDLGSEYGYYSCNPSPASKDPESQLTSECAAPIAPIRLPRQNWKHGEKSEWTSFNSSILKPMLASEPGNVKLLAPVDVSTTCQT